MANLLSRRRFLRASSAVAAAALAASTVRCRRAPQAPAILTSGRPLMEQGIASGDVTATSAIIWSRCDRPAQMLVEWSTTESFAELTRIVGPAAVPQTGLTARLDLRGLPPGQRIFYRVRFLDLADTRIESVPLTGTFRTAPLSIGRNVRFAWSGDTVGQGWGINPEFGGLRMYRTIRDKAPDFFIHSGDTIYADIPLYERVTLDDGTIWRNIVTPAKSNVAQTLDEFRGNYLYNLLDDNLRLFNASIPTVAQWDDHEVRNNWYPGQVLNDLRYQERNVDVLAARARQAFLEHMPNRIDPADPTRIYRSLAFGPLLDVFVIDQRSYRGPNSNNRQPVMSPATDFLGQRQLQWLKDGLAKSTALWKVIAADMPLGLICRDGPETFENAANGDGPPLGRELEMADLLSFLKARRIRNVVFVTADVHYATSLHFHPDRAVFKDFDPFWEFVSGPMHAGSYGPAELDPTFGPQVLFKAHPPAGRGGAGPAEGYQYFGLVEIDAASGVMTVRQHDLAGLELYRIDIQPVRPAWGA